jgi:hypothetical protein
MRARLPQSRCPQLNQQATLVCSTDAHSADWRRGCAWRTGRWIPSGGRCCRCGTCIGGNMSFEAVLRDTKCIVHLMTVRVTVQRKMSIYPVPWRHHLLRWCTQQLPTKFERFRSHCTAPVTFLSRTCRCCGTSGAAAAASTPGWTTGWCSSCTCAPVGPGLNVATRGVQSN